MRENILLTIKYFDLFDYPLKKEELWQWLFNTETLKHLNTKALKHLNTKALKHGNTEAFKHLNTKALKHGNTEAFKDGNTERLKHGSAGEVGYEKNIGKDGFERELGDLIKAKRIEAKDGYYFLPGRKRIIQIRQQRYQVSLKKLKKAQRIGKLLALVPGVRMIAVVSNLGYLNAEDGADIDLFIVARHGKIWSVRFWCVVLMKLLRQRPTAKTIKNKICLSYFVDENNLNLRPTAIAEPDVHLVYLLSQYVLIYDQGNYWEKYIQQNRWMNRYLPNFQYTAEAKKWAIKFKWAWLKEMLEKTELGFENKLYKNIQLGWMAPVLKRAMNKDDKKVIVNDQILKLHVNDKRREINSKIINYKF